MSTPHAPAGLAALFDRWGRVVYARRWLVLALCALAVALGGWSAMGARDVLYGATVEIPGMGTHVGGDAIRDAYAAWTPRRPQRHLVLNTLVTEWTADEAHATSDVVFLLKGKDGWAVQVVGRYADVLHRVADADGLDANRWRFHRRRASFLD